jgi:hypothetical protein
MRDPEEPVCIDIFLQNPVFISLHLKCPVHDAPPLAGKGREERYLVWIKRQIVKIIDDYDIANNSPCYLLYACGS